MALILTGLFSKKWLFNNGWSHRLYQKMTSFFELNWSKGHFLHTQKRVETEIVLPFTIQRTLLFSDVAYFTQCISLLILKVKWQKSFLTETIHIPMYTYSMAWIKAILEIAQFFCWFRYCYSMNLSDNAVLDKTSSSSVIFNLGYKSWYSAVFKLFGPLIRGISALSK